MRKVNFFDFCLQDQFLTKLDNLFFILKLKVKIFFSQNNMQKSTELSEFEHGRIIGMWEAGLSERGIQKKTEHKKTTIHDTIARYRDRGQIKSTLRPGRPVIASARDKRGLIKIIKKDRTQTLFDVTDQFNETTNLSVSSSTVRRYLHELGHYGRAGLRKPLISEKTEKIV
jgi:transposase